MSMHTTRPAFGEFNEYYADYIQEAPDGDILQTLARQGDDTHRLLSALDEKQAMHRYADGKWSVKEVALHLADAERVFGYRALTFARADAGPLPGFDENSWTPESHADRRPIQDIAGELTSARQANLRFFAGVDEEQWLRRGTASGNPFSVRALAWIIAGHQAHHIRILKERYLNGA